MSSQQKNWTIYMLRCKDGSLYTGITTDLDRRVKEHVAGTGAKYTRAKGPCVLVWSQNGLTETQAKQDEYRIKQLRKFEKEQMIN